MMEEGPYLVIENDHFVVQRGFNRVAPKIKRKMYDVSSFELFAVGTRISRAPHNTCAKYGLHPERINMIQSLKEFPISSIQGEETGVDADPM